MELLCYLYGVIIFNIPTFNKKKHIHFSLKVGFPEMASALAGSVCSRWSEYCPSLGWTWLQMHLQKCCWFDELIQTESPLWFPDFQVWGRGGISQIFFILVDLGDFLFAFWQIFHYFRKEFK